LSWPPRIVVKSKVALWPRSSCFTWRARTILRDVADIHRNLMAPHCCSERRCAGRAHRAALFYDMWVADALSESDPMWGVIASSRGSAGSLSSTLARGIIRLRICYIGLPHGHATYSRLMRRVTGSAK